MRPLRILWVKVGGLWPPTTGGRLRSLHMLDELSRRHRVGLVTTHQPADDPAGFVAGAPVWFSRRSASFVNWGPVLFCS